MQVLLGGVRQVSGTHTTYLHSSIIYYVHVRENENAVTTNTDLASCSSPEQLGSSNKMCFTHDGGSFCWVPCLGS